MTREHADRQFFAAFEQLEKKYDRDAFPHRAALAEAQAVFDKAMGRINHQYDEDLQELKRLHKIALAA